MTLAVLSAAGAFSTGRIIQLDEHGDRRRFIIDAPEIQLAADGASKETWVTVTREGKFSDPRYGDFEISSSMLDNMVKNFEAGVFGQKVFIDVAHKPNDGAAGEVLKLSHERQRLRALVRWTPLGVDAVNNRGYTYLSIEYAENFQDNEHKTNHGPTMLGAALVVRPALKRLDPVGRIELAENDDHTPTFLHPHLHAKFLQEISVNKEQMIKQLREKLAARGFSAENIDKIVATAGKQLEAITDEATIKALAESYDAIVETAVAQGATRPGAVITLNAPAVTGGMSADQVRQLMADEAAKTAAAAKKLAEDLQGVRVKLAEAVNKATGIPQEARNKVLADVDSVLAAGMSDAQITALAATLVTQLNAAAVATQLASRGYPVTGSVILSVDETNSVKKLQEHVDRRLSLSGAPSDTQLHNLGGTMPKKHQEYIDKCLAQFDALHGARLAAETKLLAAGTGSVSDISVPTIWERTVLREQLYELVGLSFCDVGTETFADLIRVPYSYRDTTAATRDSIRVYEGQGIPRAGVKQTYDEARPLPQKIAFLLSDEMQLLSTNGGINYDAMADNIRNCGRIVGEDTERLIFDEHVRASDEYAVTQVSAEALTGVNGTNKYFILAQFPVAKPRFIKDLKGTLQSTVNPIVVTYNSVVRSEYDGTGTQASGTYYVMDYNIGEIYLVSELGAVVTPPNATPFTVSYGYTTNVFKFDTDLGSATTKDKWDDFLYKFGLRKSVIEDQRFYATNFGLMSGNVRSQVEQAGQFQANFQKSGTNLATDGNLGVIKGVPQYKTICPGLMMGDRRVILGQRNQIRLRMLKPWAMEQLQPARTSGGLFTAQKEAYGTQWIVVHSPTLLKGALTSIVIYGATARANRATP